MSVTFVSHELACNVIRFSRMPKERSPALAPGPLIYVNQSVPLFLNLCNRRAKISRDLVRLLPHEIESPTFPAKNLARSREAIASRD